MDDTGLASSGAGLQGSFFGSRLPAGQQSEFDPAPRVFPHCFVLMHLRALPPLTECNERLAAF